MILQATPEHRKLCATDSRRGIVLFVVMVLVAMVAFAGFGFVSMMSTEYQSTRRHGDDLQAAQAIASAESLVLNFAQWSETQRAESGGHSHNPGMFRGIPLQPDQPSTLRQNSQPDAAPTRWHVSVISPPAANATGEHLRFGLQNESARLHLATLLAWDRLSPGSGRRALRQLPQMTDALADSILDWIDADDQPREFGAESDTYLASGRGYLPRQALPQSLDELLLVEGVTRELLLGRDRNRNFEVDASETSHADTVEQPRSSTGTAEPNLGGWSDYLTLHSSERNQDPLGNPRVNLNQDDLQRLATSLSDRLPDDLTRFIIAWRQYGPLGTSGSTVPANSRHSEPIPEIDLARPARFRLASLCDLIDARVRLEPATDDQDTRRLLNSPLSSSSAGRGRLLEALLTHTTLSNQAVMTGRININEAPAAVLNGIPGLSQDTVQQIVMRRQQDGVDIGRTTAWVWLEGIVDLAEYRRMQPWTTCGGDAFRGQLAVFQAGFGPIHRSQIIVGPLRDGVHRLHWSSLRSRGSGFSPQQLRQPDFMD